MDDVNKGLLKGAKHGLAVSTAAGNTTGYVKGLYIGLKGVPSEEEVKAKAEAKAKRDAEEQADMEMLAKILKDRGVVKA